MDIKFPAILCMEYTAFQFTQWLACAEKEMFAVAELADGADFVSTGIVDTNPRTDIAGIFRRPDMDITSFCEQANHFTFWDEAFIRERDEQIWACRGLN